jgi:AcrR family transcriptional regulator
MSDAGSERPPPSTERGRRTRAKVVKAARRVFERDGYLNTRLADISAEAGVAAGTFYTYFSSKEEVFEAVIADGGEDLIPPGLSVTSSAADAIERISATHREFLAMYKRSARLWGLFEQVIAMDKRFRNLRRRMADDILKRNAEGIRDLQAQGLADPDLDPVLAAAALAAMDARMAYRTYVWDENWDDEALATTLDQLWTNALGLRVDDGRAKTSRRPSAKASGTAPRRSAGRRPKRDPARPRPKTPPSK